MSITDSILDKLGDIATNLIADELVGVVRKAVTKLLGDEKDDGIAEAVARAGLEGMAARAAFELEERRALGNLNAEAARVLGAIAAIDVDSLGAKPHGHAGPQEVEILPPNTEGPYRTLSDEMAEMGLTSSSDKPDAG